MKGQEMPSHPKASSPLCYFCWHELPVSAASCSNCGQARMESNDMGEIQRRPGVWVSTTGPGWGLMRLPENVQHGTYHSAIMQREVGYGVYLPPSYSSNSTRRYPCLFHLHGGGGSETSDTRFAVWYDSLCRTSKLPETVIIFPNGLRWSAYGDSKDGTSAENMDEAKRRTQCWFVDETMAKTWSAYALRHNAARLVKPFCDSTDYIASREMLPPHPAGQPLTLAADSYWFKQVRKIEFYAGTECVASVSTTTDNPQGLPWEAVWSTPATGVHALYAVLIDESGKRCVTKPCPLVVIATTAP